MSAQVPNVSNPTSSGWRPQTKLSNYGYFPYNDLNVMNAFASTPIYINILASELTAPTALDSTLVHQYIVFHFDDGWDCGQRGRKVDSSKHTESFHPVEAQCFIDCSSTSSLSARGDLTTAWVVLYWAVSPQREPQRKHVVGQLLIKGGT